MTKRISRWIGIIMFGLAVAFFAFALNHPEKSFPWSNTITYTLYGAYLVTMLVMLIAPFKKRR